MFRSKGHRHDGIADPTTITQKPIDPNNLTVGATITLISDNGQLLSYSGSDTSFFYAIAPVSTIAVKGATDATGGWKLLPVGGNNFQWSWGQETDYAITIYDNRDGNGGKHQIYSNAVIHESLSNAEGNSVNGSTGSYWDVGGNGDAAPTGSITDTLGTWVPGSTPGPMSEQPIAAPTWTPTFEALHKAIESDQTFFAIEKIPFYSGPYLPSLPGYDLSQILMTGLTPNYHLVVSPSESIRTP